MMARGLALGFSVFPWAREFLTPRANKQIAATKTIQYVSFLLVNTVSAPMDSGCTIPNFHKHTFEKFG